MKAPEQYDDEYEESYEREWEEESRGTRAAIPSASHVAEANRTGNDDEEEGRRTAVHDPFAERRHGDVTATNVKTIFDLQDILCEAVSLEQAVVPRGAEVTEARGQSPEGAAAVDDVESSFKAGEEGLPAGAHPVYIVNDGLRVSQRESSIQETRSDAQPPLRRDDSTSTLLDDYVFKLILSCAILDTPPAQALTTSKTGTGCMKPFWEAAPIVRTRAVGVSAAAAPQQIAVPPLLHPQSQWRAHVERDFSEEAASCFISKADYERARIMQVAAALEHPEQDSRAEGSAKRRPDSSCLEPTTEETRAFEFEYANFVARFSRLGRAEDSGSPMARALLQALSEVFIDSVTIQLLKESTLVRLRAQTARDKGKMTVSEDHAQETDVKLRRTPLHPPVRHRMSSGYKG